MIPFGWNLGSNASTVVWHCIVSVPLHFLRHAVESKTQYTGYYYGSTGTGSSKQATNHNDRSSRYSHWKWTAEPYSQYQSLYEYLTLHQKFTKEYRSTKRRTFNPSITSTTSTTPCIQAPPHPMTIRTSAVIPVVTTQPVQVEWYAVSVRWRHCDNAIPNHPPPPHMSILRTTSNPPPRL